MTEDSSSTKVTISRKGLDDAITQLRVLIASNLKETDTIVRIGIKHELTRLKNEIARLYNSEVSDFLEDTEERRRIILDEIKRELDEYEKSVKEKGGEFSDRDSVLSSITQDHPEIIKLNEELRGFMSDMVVGDLPFKAFKKFDKPEGLVKIATNDGGTLTYDAGAAYDFLVKKGFIVVSNTHTKTKDKNGKNKQQ